jgi:hypothetical protein
MRLMPFLPVFLFYACIPLHAQQSPPARQDPQAVNILNQALSLAGGSQAHRAVLDYTGSGNITYHSNTDVSGPVSIKGLGSINVRIDATLPHGVRSWAIHDGVTSLKSENGKLSVANNVPNVRGSDAFPYQTPMFPGSLAFPYRQLTNVLNNPSFTIIYKGMAQVDGHSVHDIQVQRISAGGNDPMSKYNAREFFIDKTTFHIVMTQDTVPRDVVHQVHYSNYTPVSGVLVPFVIAEDVGGAPTWTIQLSQIAFNSGLGDSSFALQ